MAGTDVVILCNKGLQPYQHCVISHNLSCLPDIYTNLFLHNSLFYMAGMVFARWFLAAANNQALLDVALIMKGDNFSVSNTQHIRNKKW